MKNPVWLLGGFLGEGLHWGEFPAALEHQLGTPVEVFDWAQEVSGAKNLSEAARSLLQRAFSEGLRPVLVGYSMGGRLALQAALEGAGTLSAVVAVSAHLGLALESERQERCLQDAAWGKLLREDFSEFWRRWNQQEALQGTQALPRPELTQLQRERWAKLLENLGTGTQDYLPALLSEARLPLLWLAGTADTKYAAMQKLLPAGVETQLIPAAGHRVPLDAPLTLAEVIAPFIRRSQEIL